MKMKIYILSVNLLTEYTVKWNKQHTSVLLFWYETKKELNIQHISCGFIERQLALKPPFKLIPTPNKLSKVNHFYNNISNYSSSVNKLSSPIVLSSSQTISLQIYVYLTICVQVLILFSFYLRRKIYFWYKLIYKVKLC